MNKAQFYNYLKYPELLDDRSLGEIEQILAEYPYFQSARLLHIKNLSNQGSISYDRELKRTAVWVTDRRKLFYLLDNRVLLPVDFDSKQKTAESLLNNIVTIDFSALTQVTSFKTETEPTNTNIELNDELSQLIMSGSAQASTFFKVDDKIDLEDFKNTFGKKNQTDTPNKKNSPNSETRRKNLIDNFITEQPKITYDEKKPEEKEDLVIEKAVDEPEMITDTLAKIYINQHKYEKAILAYEKLSLKYPKKNIYFASQIKKIKQFINNQ